MTLIKIASFTGFLLYSTLGFAKNVTSNTPCHPLAQPNTPQYIIGYGSLIQSQSKDKTYYGAGNNKPVMIYGYQRGWFARDTPASTAPFGTTFLGIIPDKKSKFNGIIFKAPAQALPNYDVRENIYCRKEVSPEQIQLLTHEPLPKGQFWIYVPQPQSFAFPSTGYPLAQSYIDTFLSGCLEIQQQYYLKNFANDCIDTTHNWSSFWLNDRVYRGRLFNHLAPVTEVDVLLLEKMPEIFPNQLP